MNPKVIVSSEPKQMVSYTHQPVSSNTQNFEKYRTPNLYNFGTQDVFILMYTSSITKRNSKQRLRERKREDYTNRTMQVWYRSRGGMTIVFMGGGEGVLPQFIGEEEREEDRHLLRRR